MNAFFSAARAEFLRMGRSPALLVLTVVQAVTFLFLVSLFSKSGSMAPTALVDLDHGVYARQFLRNLRAAHHAFALTEMATIPARRAVDRGDLVAVITIPPNFSDDMTHGKVVTLQVVLDNIDTDMIEDIQRALPSAVLHFGVAMKMPAIHVQPREHDLHDHETEFVHYLVISALVLDALIIAGMLAGVAVVREFESGTFALLQVSPTSPLVPLLGRLLATATVALLALLLAAGVVVVAYGIRPVHPLEMAAVLLLCTGMFSCVGAALGALVRRTLPVASFIFGIAIPLYLVSNAYEPQRFDGLLVWCIAHCSPAYYAVGIMEHAAFGLLVTPESLPVLYAALGGWTGLALLSAWACVRRKVGT